jgi:hypothetical protein
MVAILSGCRQRIVEPDRAIAGNAVLAFARIHRK